ncbi:MAG: retroviral-like aspartic protease family protein [Elusimicrobia bacterium]|nr:retroviral-like aspartic protease family protein [Elusimicrobiota bacterium]
MRALLLVLLLRPGLAQADEVLLKTGRSMAGLIQGETSSELTLDFGYGTTVLQKEDIESIRRSSPKERQALKRRFLGQAAQSGALKPPPGAEELGRLLDAARRSREAAQDARREREDLQAQREELILKMRELKLRQPSLASALNSADPQNPGYNSLVGEVNGLNAGLQAAHYQHEEAGRKLEEGEAATERYFGDYGALRRYAAAHLKSLRAAARDEDGRVFYETADADLVEMARDFKREASAARRLGEHLVVDVLFNGAVRAPMLVDTGASQTMISPKVADAAGLTGGETVETTVADGRRVQGRLIVVDSLAVGASRVEKTPVVVLAAPGPGAEGLLGMSFLKNFMFQLDMPNNRLILERLAQPAPARP